MIRQNHEQELVLGQALGSKASCTDELCAAREVVPCIHLPSNFTERKMRSEGKRLDRDEPCAIARVTTLSFFVEVADNGVDPKPVAIDVEVERFVVASHCSAQHGGPSGKWFEQASPGYCSSSPKTSLDRESRRNLRLKTRSPRRASSIFDSHRDDCESRPRGFYAAPVG